MIDHEANSVWRSSSLDGLEAVIRVDASTHTGLGHLVRCRTLATFLRARGAGIRFICRAHPGHRIADLEADAFPVGTLPTPPPATIADDDYAGWLGVTQAQDAAETLTALGDGRPDWLIVDHYGLDAEWEQALRPRVGRILVIDDLANRRHDCDLLLDQNHVRHGSARYQALLPTGARLLLGPRYALLHPAYREWRQTLRPRTGEVLHLLIFFGGSDPRNLTGLALNALAMPALAHLTVNVVVGANNPHQTRIAAQVATRPSARLYGPRPHLADLMAEADLAIGAGGATTWERCCLGLPSLVVSIADNQRPASTALAADGFIQYLGDQDGVTVATLREAVLSLVSDPVRRRALSMAGTELVDGEGAMRVIEAMRQRGRTSIVNDSTL